MAVCTATTAPLSKSEPGPRRNQSRGPSEAATACLQSLMEHLGGACLSLPMPAPLAGGCKVEAGTHPSAGPRDTIFGLREDTMVSGLLTRPIGLLLMLLPAAAFAAVTPYPPYPGAVPSVAYKVAVDGQIGRASCRDLS